MILGKSGSKSIGIDLDVLLRTRMLIQANSGGGKSYLIRRLVEQLFGKVQIIIIDREGEFPSLREKFSFVLVGKGGETPADPRSAALVARRLLELKASAVCDLYEMKTAQRHRWLKLFLEALVDAPKEIWTPVIVIVDEAHDFCPEKGESEAAAAMIDLTTRGRKRGLCAVFATQRLAKLNKNAAAELLNILIGMSWIDVDRKRAAEALGIGERKAVLKFFDDVKTMEAGNFYALGRAFTKDEKPVKERLMLKVGKVQTTHPEPGSTKHAAAPPPAPAKLKKLLPSLADLPKEAEEQAKTEGELRREVRSLKAQLRAGEKARPASQVQTQTQTKIEIKEIKVALISDKQLRALQGEAHRLINHAGKLEAKAQVLRGFADNIKECIQGSHQAMDFTKQAAAEARKAAKAMPKKEAIATQRTVMLKPTPARAPVQPSADTNGSEFTKKQQDIIRALAEFLSIGKTDVPRTWVAARSGASHKSSAFGNNLGTLRTAGMIDYGAGRTVILTEQGKEIAPPMAVPLNNEEMLESCLALLTAKQQAILRVLHEAHPSPVGREDLAEAAGASATSSAYGNNLGSLRSAGMIEYGPERTVKCENWLFVEESF